MMETFAERVKFAAAKHAANGRAAIAKVYDEYGIHFPDAGPSKTFKARLVEAAKNRELELGRLDMPECMERELRERSATTWDRETVHFVVLEWK